jgi:hypothetical protein
MSKTNINGEEISVITSDIEGAKYSSSPTTANLINESIPSWQNVLETTGGNPSNDIAFVSDSGNDGTAQVGNPTKPFLTIQSAINAVVNNSIVKVLGGTYTQDILINGRSNLVLDMSGCTYTTITTNGGFKVENSQNVTILNYGGVMNAYVNIGLSGNLNVNFFGGKVISGAFPCINLGNKGRVNDVQMQNTGTQTISGVATTVENRPVITNCSIKTTSVNTSHAAIFRVQMALFENCYIEGPIALSTESNSSHCTLIDCTLVSTLSTTIKGEGEVLNAVLKNCTIKANTAGQDNIRMSLNSVNTRFYNCNFIAPRNCVIISSAIDRLGDNTIFQDCSFFPNQDGGVTGKVLNDAANTGTGSTQFINCVYSEAWSTNAANAFNNNGLLISGLLPPPL